jgi:hypothetical protein
MFQEEFCQLFSRSGVPTVYQVAHLCNPARDYRYRIVAIRPWESGDEVHRGILPRSVGNRQGAQNSKGGASRGPRAFTDVTVFVESFNVSSHFGPEVGVCDKF